MLPAALFVGGARMVRLRRRVCSVVVQPCISDLCVDNQPPLHYCADSNERALLRWMLRCNAYLIDKIPIVIGDDYVCEGEPKYQTMPHDHNHKIAEYYHASEETIKRAIDMAVAVQWYWDRVPISERIRVWLTAAEMAANECRQTLNSASMLGQSKTLMQAELDTCEIIDSLRYSAFFINEHLRYQPESPCPNMEYNSMRFRGLDGFVAAVSPFNSTAIACDLVATPVIMGNCVIWKPDDCALLSNWLVYKILRAAGLPGGVINFVPSDHEVFESAITSSQCLAGINYSGSVETFNNLWKEVAGNIDSYKNYPRLVGETGGNSYHLVHPSADVDTVVACTIRAAFEYSGQKSSSCSRLYIPRSLEQRIVNLLLIAQAQLMMGDPRDFSVFTGAIINKQSYQRLIKIIINAEKNESNKVLAGGKYTDEKGYFIEPTIIQTKNMGDFLMTEQIFGPILTIYVYDDHFLYQIMTSVAASSKYALAASIFAEDVCWLELALDTLKYTAGNLYVNDKCTGSIVGKQPYGGGRLSGTNDKSGGPHYMMRWCSPQTIKERFIFDTNIIYPYMVNIAGLHTNCPKYE